MESQIGDTSVYAYACLPLPEDLTAGAGFFGVVLMLLSLDSLIAFQPNKRKA